MKKRTTWIFEGAVIRNGVIATKSYNAVTVAGTYKEAYRNIVFGWKKKMGFTVHCDVQLEGNLYRIDPKPYVPKKSKRIKTDYEQLQMDFNK